MEGLTYGPKRYTSVQCGPGPDDNVELNSDLVYGEHDAQVYQHRAKQPSRSQPLLRAERSIRLILSKIH